MLLLKSKILIVGVLIMAASTFCLSFLMYPTSTQNARKDDRPNIVLIMADDMGYSDLGLFGSEINTPHLDKLAKNGLILTQFYNTSRCCPSRAALLTGIYQHEAGVGDMNNDRGFPNYQGYLNKQCVTIAEVLKDAGYTTMMSGKWHLGDKEEYWPRQRGFEHFFGIPQGGGVYFYPFRDKREVVLNDAPIPVDTTTFYTTDAFNEYAVKFIRQHAENKQEVTKPFFLYLPHIAPHFPLQAHDEDIARYRGKYKAGFEAIRKARFEKMKTLGIVGSDTKLSPRDKELIDWNTLTESQKDTFDLRMSVYAAQLECMDRGIGDIISTLTSLRMLDNTVILFLSDNGGTHEYRKKELKDTRPIGSRYSFATYSRSWANVSNTPFRMYKHWVHEGGISTPLLVHYPKMIKKPRIDHQVAHIMDIMPTCLELAGATYPTRFKGNNILPLKGKGLLPILTGQKMPSYGPLFWEHEGNRAIRDGKWKLVSKYPQDTWELYDLENDRTELIDLSKEKPELVTKMTRMYTQWEKETGVLPWKTVSRK